MEFGVTVWANDAFGNIKELENTSPTISTKVERLWNDIIFAIGIPICVFVLTIYFS